MPAPPDRVCSSVWAFARHPRAHSDMRRSSRVVLPVCLALLGFCAALQQGRVNDGSLRQQQAPDERREARERVGAGGTGGGNGGNNGGLSSSSSGQTTSDPAAAMRKRGVGSRLTVAETEALRGLSWFYTWGARIGDDSVAAACKAAGIEFIPMAWGRWGLDTLAETIEPGSTVLLGFNEPNHHGQANMTAQEAAALWPKLEAAADKLGLRLGSPAAAPCGAECVEPNPFKWLDDFFAACKGCRVDFIASHYYACNPDWLRGYIQQCKKYGRPVWLTEYACPNPGGAEARSVHYLASALPFLDADAGLERHAWFTLRTSGWLGTSNSLMGEASNTLTDLGSLFLTPPDASPGSSSGRSSSGSRTDGSSSENGAVDKDSGAWEPPAAAEGRTWSELCAPCIEHLEGGAPLSALPPRQQRYCSWDCGFWDRRQA